jgi:hypothetical protein
MNPKTQHSRLGAALCSGGLLAAVCLAPHALRAEPIQAVEDVRHWVGEEDWHLKVMARDSEDRITQELGMDNGNEVTRSTAFYSNGKKSEQETLVHSELPGKRLLYDEKSNWSRSGKLEYSFHETDGVNSSGDQEKGERNTKKFEYGHMLSEVTEDWSPDTKGWTQTYIQTQTYYKDGDAKECITEHPTTNEKTDETWGPKGEHGRDKTTRTWDASTQSWNG